MKPTLVKPTPLSEIDAQFIETRRQMVEEIARVFSRARREHKWRR